MSVRKIFRDTFYSLVMYLLLKIFQPDSPIRNKTTRFVMASILLHSGAGSGRGRAQNHGVHPSPAQPARLRRRHAPLSLRPGRRPRHAGPVLARALLFAAPRRGQSLTASSTSDRIFFGQSEIERMGDDFSLNVTR